MDISIKAIKDPPSSDDGLRIFVDRAWPRGVVKAKVAVDVWAKSVAPSPELSKWFGADAQKWREFKKKYLAELDANPQSVADIAKLASMQKVTFLHSSKSAKQNHAILLRDYLLQHAQSF